MKKKYEDDEEGPALSVCINADEVSLDVKPDVGIPEEEWYKDGWELTPLVPAKVCITSFSYHDYQCFSLN